MATAVRLGARTFLGQALELIDNPGRSGGWELVDVPLLQSIGRRSMGVAEAIGAFERLVPEFAARLAAPGALLLDIGTGTGWLAIALARAHPALQVVGLDIFEPALDLARTNIAAADLILAEAGGIATDHLGAPFDYNLPAAKQKSLVCAGPAMHPLLIDRVGHIEIRRPIQP